MTTSNRSVQPSISDHREGAGVHPMHELERKQTRKTTLLTALVALLPLLALACGDYGAPTTSADSASTTFGTGLPDGLSVAEQVTSFETTVYPVLRANCSGCHDAAGPGAPRIAHVDSSTAWSAVVDNQKVNFSDLSQSRLVRRLGSDLHFCWSDCATDANTMLTEIQNWQDAIEAAGGSTASVDVANLVSDTRTSLDGFEEVGAERFDDGQIARWEFKELTGTVAADTSGVDPAMDLTLEGDVTFMSNYGIDIADGRAIADELTSTKFYDRVADAGTGTQQYSIEMWVAPANITQDGPARMFTYSRSSGTRNMMLGQVAYQYVARNRSFNETTNNNGNPEMETYDVDQDAQATLQHVVLTYDQIAGRRFYVDGRFTDDVDETPTGRLWNWATNHQVILGNERSNDRPWIGKVRFAAIYERALSPAAVQQNYEAGIGKRITLVFDVSEWTGGNSTIEFSLTELDAYSYLFCSPTFVTDVGAPIRVQNMRISLNGIVPVSGQGFTTLDALVTSPRQLLSRQCSVVGGLVDPNTDTFQLSFEQLGIFQEPIDDPDPPVPSAEDFGDPVPVLGVRSFARVNASMAAVSGVDPQTATVDDTYDALVTQLPATNDLRSFVSANQVGIAKLGIEYCDVIVEDDTVGGMRSTFFDGASTFGWTSAPAVAFADPADVDMITDPILDKIIGAGLRGDVGGFPARDQAEDALDDLVTDLLGSCGGAGPPVQPDCDEFYTRSMVKGLCAAAISSGAVHIH